MDKKEFVQRYIIAIAHAASANSTTEDKIKRAVTAYDEIEKAFSVTPTTNLWDYNDMQR